MPNPAIIPVQVCGNTWHYHAPSGAWASGPQLSTPRYAAATTACGHQIVIAGGQDNANVLADVEVLDMERGWQRVAPLGDARKYHGMACVNRCACRGTTCMACS